MKRRGVIRLVAAIVPAAVLADVVSPPPAVQWVKFFSGYGSAAAHFVQQVSDGGFAVAGTTIGDTGTKGADYYVIRTDSLGNVMWERTYGLDDDVYDKAFSIEQLDDGSLVVCGMRADINANAYAYLFRTDSTGGVLWERWISRDSGQVGFQATPAGDGGFYVSGADWLRWDTSTYVVKCDSLGFPVWQRFLRRLPASKADYVPVQRTADGGCVTTGLDTADGALLFKLNAAGALLWTRSFPEQKLQTANYVIQTSDKGFAVTGAAASTAPDHKPWTDAYILKTDTLGNMKWRRSYGGTEYDEGMFLCETSDHGFLLTGVTEPTSKTVLDVYLLRCDSAGDMLWEWSCGSPHWRERGHCGRQTTDGGYVVTGAARDTTTGKSRAFLAKLAPDARNGRN